MNFRDQGIIINTKKQGENSLFVKILSKDYGLYSAFAKITKKNRYLYQISNIVEFNSYSKTEGNLGCILKIELIQSFLSKIIFNPIKINCLTSLIAIIKHNTPEREPNRNLFNLLINFFNFLTESDDLVFLKKYIEIELNLLKILGYGLSLERCIVSRNTKNLIFVSPKSACAVSSEFGKKYENKLLRLPSFLTKKNENPFVLFSEIIDGLNLTSFFIKKNLYNNKSRNYKKFIFLRQELFNRIITSDKS